MREARKHYKATGHENYVSTHLSEERVREAKQRFEQRRKRK